MRPLQQKFEELERILLRDRQALDQNTGVPFVRLLYPPREEVACQRLQEALARTLLSKGVAVETVSCRDVIFAHYEARGRLEQAFELDRSGERRLGQDIARCARQELTARLLRATERLDGDGVILVTDVAFLYPYLHLSPVLDDCTNKIISPVALVILYPGEVDADGRVLFLGQRPSGYYRTRDLV